MGDFDQHTKPLYNQAKDNLIEKSLAPAERFYRDWSRGLLPLPFITCGVQQLYDAFQVWCNRSGESKYTSLTIFSPSVERYAGATLRKKAILYEYGAKVKQRFVFLVGDQPDGASLREWAENASSLFEGDLKAYRHRGGPDVEG
jgi:putative DNA primase/helicase